MLLERRYLSEQATPTTGTTTGVTTSAPTTPTESPKTETAKISETDKKNLIKCSSISKLSSSKTEGETYKEGNITYTIYMLNNKPYCKDKKEES